MTVPRKLLVVSLAGASSKSIYDVVRGVVSDRLEVGTYQIIQSKGAMVCGPRDLLELHELIEGCDDTYNRFMMVGKSAGGVLAWWYMMNYFAYVMYRFDASAVLLIDPHGSVLGDGEVGPYNQFRDLEFAKDYKRDAERIWFFNVFQHRKGLTGASFPELRFDNAEIEVKDSNVDHENIITMPQTIGQMEFVLDLLMGE